MLCPERRVGAKTRLQMLQQCGRQRIVDCAQQLSRRAPLRRRLPTPSHRRRRGRGEDGGGDAISEAQCMQMAVGVRWAAELQEKQREIIPAPRQRADILKRQVVLGARWPAVRLAEGDPAGNGRQHALRNEPSAVQRVLRLVDFLLVLVLVPVFIPSCASRHCLLRKSQRLCSSHSGQGPYRLWDLHPVATALLARWAHGTGGETASRPGDHTKRCAPSRQA